MSIPVTEEGKRNLQVTLEEMEARLPVIRKAIEEAREKGDLRENSEYHAAREDLGLLQAQIADLRSRLAQAEVIDPATIDHDIVGFGARVELKDLQDGSVEEWSMVGQGEDDPLENKILTTSPMGQALIGHRSGETISVSAPVGELRYQIISIAY